jgi:hypothetical protein
MQYQSRTVILPWVLATVAGVTIGILSSLSFVVRLALAGTPTGVVGLVGGAALGGGIGVAQWLVLRRHIGAAGWWAVASVIGGMVGVALGLVLGDTLHPLLATVGAARPAAPGGTWGSALPVVAAGAVIGVTMGSAQWLVLRRYVRSAGWWIVGSGLGWMAGLGLGSGAIDAVTLLGSLLIVGIVSGVTTGSVLACLLAGDFGSSRHAGTT